MHYYSIFLPSNEALLSVKIDRNASYLDNLHEFKPILVHRLSDKNILVVLRYSSS